jgi:hypothetical protein
MIWNHRTKSGRGLMSLSVCPQVGGERKPRSRICAEVKWMRLMSWISKLWTSWEGWINKWDGDN